MKQEYIDLLRKDIAARLPYKPVVTNEKLDGGYGHRLHLGDLATSRYIDSLNIENTKVYLRPMSSMTEEEKRELKELHFYYTDDHIVNDEDNDFKPIIVDEMHCSYIIDWLNKHYFDYRGLIPMGLAIEAQEGMYK